MNEFGNRIRELRLLHNIRQHQIAALLKTDTAFVSKMENGMRNPKREQVLALANLFNVNESTFLALWMGEKIVQEIKDEEYAQEALEVAIRVINKLKTERIR